jgi:antitoxin VapB
MLWHMPHSKPTTGRHARLFRNGRNQAVRIPRELELPGTEALLYREGDRLIVEPIAGPTLLNLIASWDRIDTGWPDVDDPAPKPVRLAD